MDAAILVMMLLRDGEDRVTTRPVPTMERCAKEAEHLMTWRPDVAAYCVPARSDAAKDKKRG